MEFSITSDIDTDLLHWDDENDDKQDRGSSSGHTSEAKEEDQTNSSSNNLLNASSLQGSTASMSESEFQHLPQHISDQLEPMFQPNYFLSSGLSWDPSQPVTNATAPKAPKASNQVPATTEQNNTTKSKDTGPTTAQPFQQQEEWGASQISQQIALHQQAQNNNPSQNAQDLAAAVARAMLPEQASLQHSQSRIITDSSTQTGSSSSSHPSSSTSEKKKPTSNSTRQAPNNNRRSTPQNPQEPPPFYLFDAPCELRANFLQAQRQNEMTNFQDSNSFHYGMAVNGFHPQVNAQVNPIMPASLGAAVLPNGKRVELIDGRHKHKRKSSERNEREQQRAQKITELIDKLRNTMEEGGWSVEMKSKYQILSHSTDYLKHLISTTKEKERKLKKTKTELAIRNQKLEEDNALLDGRSDPESVTSSLTAGSYSDSKVRGSKGSTEDSSTSTNVAVASIGTGKETSKRKGSSHEQHPEDAQEPNKKCARISEKNDDDSNHDSNQSSFTDGKNISIGKMSSSISDMTDSNRGSSDGQGSKGAGSSDGQGSKGTGSSDGQGSKGTGSSDGQGSKGTGSSDGQGNGFSEHGSKITGSSDGQGNGSKDVKASFDLSLLAEKEMGAKSESSISSTAAVVSGVGSGTHDHRDTDIIFTRDWKRKHHEKTSLDEGFELSYQEVFLASNVPQLIATPAGRIVACNDFFFRVTGLTQKEVKRITIFSMVQVDQLSTLFDLVAKSLRTSNSFESSSKNHSSTSSSSTGTSSDKRRKESYEFETVTLPCIPFPQELATSGNASQKTLFMNVTFMYDSNPSKRYIHCAVTDKRGVKGKIGTITPQLLSLLQSTHTSIKPTTKT